MIPLFSSDHSLCESILTLTSETLAERQKEDEKEKREFSSSPPLGIFQIAKKHEITRPLIVDTSVSGFWAAYRAAKGEGLEFGFGYKVCVCSDLTQKTPESLLTESNVVVFAINTQGYYDLIKLHSDANLKGFYYRPRLDWKRLNELITPNLSVTIPFYSSFIARNLMKHNQAANPILPKGTVFFEESHGLPFDALISDALQAFCKDTHPILKSHSVYYYKDEDMTAHQTLRCLQKRSSLEKPNLEHYASDQFSFESYLRNR